MCHGSLTALQPLPISARFFMAKQNPKSKKQQKQETQKKQRKQETK